MACALAVAAISVVSLAAQSEVKRTTKVEVKDGKDITTTGCVNRTTDGRYSLTSVGGEVQYMLVGHENMSKHLGHRIQVRGKATDLGDAAVKTETKTSTKVDVANGPDEHSNRTTTTEQKGNVPGIPLLDVDSVKTLAHSCQ
jgi:hypothetical protein